MATFGFVDAPSISCHYTCAVDWNAKLEELRKGIRVLYSPDRVWSGRKIRVLILEVTKEDGEELYLICLPDQDVIIVERSRLLISAHQKKHAR